MAISLIHLKRLPRPFRARNDIVKIDIAFILDLKIKQITHKKSKIDYKNDIFLKNREKDIISISPIFVRLDGAPSMCLTLPGRTLCPEDRRGDLPSPYRITFWTKNNDGIKPG